MQYLWILSSQKYLFSIILWFIRSTSRFLNESYFVNPLILVGQVWSSSRISRICHLETYLWKELWNVLKISSFYFQEIFWNSIFWHCNFSVWVFQMRGFVLVALASFSGIIIFSNNFLKEISGKTLKAKFHILLLLLLRW